jgi:hypothetical protein
VSFHAPELADNRLRLTRPYVDRMLADIARATTCRANAFAACSVRCLRRGAAAAAGIATLWAWAAARKGPPHAPLRRCHHGRALAIDRAGPRRTLRFTVPGHQRRRVHTASGLTASTSSRVESGRRTGRPLPRVAGRPIS